MAYLLRPTEVFYVDVTHYGPKSMSFQIFKIDFSSPVQRPCFPPIFWFNQELVHFCFWDSPLTENHERNNWYMTTKPFVFTLQNKWLTRIKILQLIQHKFSGEFAE